MGLEETLALTPALSPRRERPELCVRLAPLNPRVPPHPASGHPLPPGGGEGRGEGVHGQGEACTVSRNFHALGVELLHGDSRRRLCGEGREDARLAEFW